MKRKIALLLFAAATVAAAVFAEGETEPQPQTPELAAPVVLADESGKAATGLVDPFARRGADGVDGDDAAQADEDGLMRTTMGEISSDFRILAITIPEDESIPRAALIQFHASDEPILVHEGDLVRVDRTKPQGAGRRAASRRASAVRNAAAGRAAALEDELGRYVFYVNIKHIEPSFIEVYHNKKRPDETIRLNW